ncbi:hypothetical protein KJ068_20190 [bacterium]|nr:hypothetical protein [bacterium]
MLRLTCHICFGFCWLLFARTISAQPQEVRFEFLTIEHGLSNFSINDIIQDGQGFLWFATEDGLNKYDGYDFKIYKADPDDGAALPHSYVIQLYLDRSYSLWVIAGSRLCRYEPSIDGFQRFEDLFPKTKPMADKNVAAVCEDRYGNFWIGTDRGLFRYNPQEDTLVVYHADAAGNGALSSEVVRALYEDRSGTIWIGTVAGLERFDRGRNTFISYRLDAPGKGVTGIREDGRGTVWIAATDGLFYYDQPADRVLRRHFDRNITPPAGTDIVLDLFEDQNGALWIATLHLGLWRYEPATDRFFQYRHDPDDAHSLLMNRVQAVHEDRSGVMWLGHYRSGISYYARRQDRIIRNKIADGVYALLQDRSGNLWVGSFMTGLRQYDSLGRLLAHYRHDPKNPQSLSNDNVLAICEDRSGDLWIGTGYGFNRFIKSRQVFEHYLPKPANPKVHEHYQVKSIHEDKNGELWFGTNGSGLFRLHPGAGVLTGYQHDPENPQSLNPGGIWSLCEDRDGALWIGSFGGGLARFERATQTFVRYSHDPNNPAGLSHPGIYSLYPDDKGYLWIGTFGGGLNRFDPRTLRFEHYTDREGLPDNFVKGILPDDRGNLWLSTDKGLSRFNPQTKSFKNFTVKDGLVDNVLLSGAYQKGREGWLLFGGEGGFNMFHPDSLRNNSYLPPVLITNFRVFDKPLRPRLATTPEQHADRDTRHIILSHQTNFFSFEFVALDFTDARKNQYAYKLEGFDQDWTYCGARRYASYTNVDPGEYTLRVKGSNSDGVWNEAGATLNITILPPYWRTWWFRSLALGAALLLGWAIYRYRVNRLLEMERLRTRLAADLHDEIAGNLSSIAMFGKIVQDENAKSNATKLAGAELLQRIITLSQESVNSIREIIWAIDPKPESIHDLLMRVRDFAVNACRAQNMALKFDAPGAELLPAKNLSPEQRKHLWLLLKEAIHNAVKHSGGSELAIYASFKSNRLNISIIDNGAGINGATHAPKFSGKGLQTMKTRAEQLRGSFGMYSDDSGTTVNVTIKI